MEQEVTTVRFCAACDRNTNHLIKIGEGCRAYVCVSCVKRAELMEAVRD